MPTVKDTAELLAITARIDKLSSADRLRVCAELIEAGKFTIAETIAGNVVDTLRGKRLLGV